MKGGTRAFSIKGEYSCRNHGNALHWLLWKHANEDWSMSLNFFKICFFGKMAISAGNEAVPSDTQLIGLGENNFENRHESRGLTEVAGANYVGMDGQSFRVVSRFDAPCNVV